LRILGLCLIGRLTASNAFDLMSQIQFTFFLCLWVVPHHSLQGFAVRFTDNCR
jgi:hypothetical protein